VPELITSSTNPQFKAALKLAQSGRERRKTGLTLLDGLHLIKAWQSTGGHLQQIFARATLAENAEFLAWQAETPRCPVLFFSPGLYDRIVGDDFPSGVLALVETPPSVGVPRLDCDSIVLDGVQDPGNLGTLLRSAGAAGFTQAVLSVDCAQAWSPKVLRAGMGAHFAIRIHEAIDLAGFLNGFSGTVAAATLDGAQSLFQAGLAEPLAWVFGSEGGGVSAPVLSCATLKVRIPMPGKIESLNVSAAAAICLFETVRQRQSELSGDKKGRD
jgi:RNA methyltransferase, TrmH family